MRRHQPRPLTEHDLARVEAESGIPLAELVAHAVSRGWLEVAA